MDSREIDEKFLKGLREFNLGCFFEAHETWEDIWRLAPQPEKTFLQGLIQVAAALHHYTRGNLRGAHSLLAGGGKKLDQFPSTYRGVKLGALRSAVRGWLAALATGKDPGARALPKIRRSRRR